MENRYKLSKEIQTKYLQKVEFVSKLSHEQLAILFGVVGRSYRDWKRGKFAIPQRVVKIIEKKYHIDFPSSKQKTLSLWQKIKRDVSHKGGIALVQKYGGPGTPEGRRKGGIQALANMRARGIIPTEKPFHAPNGYSVELAELVGILLGDGHIGQSQWTISLNARADAQYALYVVQLIKKLFLFTPSVLHREKTHTLVIYSGGKRNIAYFQRLGLKIGNKVTQQVGVPSWITQNASYSAACLRGLNDTDGGIFKHTYVVGKKRYTYVKLSFTNRSIPLLQFVFTTLQTTGLTPKLVDKVANKRVWLYNHREVTQYIERIGTHNPRLLVNLGG